MGFGDAVGGWHFDVLCCCGCVVVWCGDVDLVGGDDLLDMVDV